MAKGRTYRQRRRKAAAQAQQAHKKVGRPSVDPEWIELQKWCKRQGLPKTKMTLAYFADTFRGMVATRDIEQGEAVVQVPEQLLITASKVKRISIARAPEGGRACMSRWSLSEHQSLAYWLYSEAGFGQASEWHAYIAALPKDFASVPLFVAAGDCPNDGKEQAGASDCMQWLQAHLPHSMRQKVAEQQARLFSDWLHTRAFLSAANSQPPTDWRLYVWAWLAANTRCIHLGRRPRRRSNASASTNSPRQLQTSILQPISSDDNIALAPILDFLNHSEKASTSIHFDEKTRCFSIKTHRSYAKGQEVFITYGPHENGMMLAEYGFVLADNPYQSLELDHAVELWTGAAKASTGHKKHRLAMDSSDIDAMVATLKRHGLWGDFSISSDALEPSYRLQAALRLLLQIEQKETTLRRAVSVWERWRKGEITETQSCFDAAMRLWIRAACEALSGLACQMLRDIEGKGDGAQRPPPGLDGYLVHCIRAVWLEIACISERCCLDQMDM